MPSLKNQLLLAMPHMSEPIFEKSVIYICDHNTEGAMGLIINKKIDSRHENSMVTKQVFNDSYNKLTSENLFIGGPVLVENGIILHHGNFKTKNTFQISSSISISNKQDDLLALQKKTDVPFKVMIGHCGWAPKQLEKEIENGDWLIQGITTDFIFNFPSNQMWQHATSALGLGIESFIGHGGKS